VIVRVFFAFLGQTNIIDIVMLPVYFPEIDVRSNSSEFV
jgi:hypothetical protein